MTPMKFNTRHAILCLIYLNSVNNRDVICPWFLLFLFSNFPTEQFSDLGRNISPPPFTTMTSMKLSIWHCHSVSILFKSYQYIRLNSSVNSLFPVPVSPQSDFLGFGGKYLTTSHHIHTINAVQFMTDNCPYIIHELCQRVSPDLPPTLSFFSVKLPPGTNFQWLRRGISYYPPLRSSLV